MCDAAGAFALPDQRVAVIDDEVNQLVIYAAAGGEPLARLPLDPVLGLDPDSKEADLEAVTRLGDDVVLLASHGRKRSGKLDLNRLRLARGRLAVGDGQPTIEASGPPYTGLVDDLLAEPALAAYGLAAASERSPKVPDGLNLEGMASDGDDLILGVRSPLVEGRALLVRIGEVDRLFAGQHPGLRGHALLDLGGRGVRDLARGSDGAGYLIAAGAPLGAPPTAAIFRWSGGDAAPVRLPLDVSDLNVEALEWVSGGLIALSDDGERLVEGTPCKKLVDPGRKSFRGVRLEAR
jgi:hypothetical protein